jgi:hypothetical protein
MLRQPLPEGLADRFSVSEALGAGASHSRLLNDDLEKPFWGVRRRGDGLDIDARVDRRGSPRGALELDHLRRALDYVPRMDEHQFFCRVTAAVILGIPLPVSLAQTDHIDVAVLAPRRLPRSKGVRGHQMVARLTTVERDPSLHVALTDPATTWASLGAVIRHPDDLIAAGDAVVRDWRSEPLASIADLQAAIDRGRRVGIGALREAIPHIRTRSASRPESRLRRVIVAAGLPEPELNHDVVEDGEHLACSDLVYPELRIAIEYEGEHHLTDSEQWAYDIARYDRLRDAGWHVIRVTKSDLFQHPERVIRRVRAAISARSSS